MEIDELEMLREQVRIQAETIASLNFDLSRNRAVISILMKPAETSESIQAAETDKNNI